MGEQAAGILCVVQLLSLGFLLFQPVHQEEVNQKSQGDEDQFDAVGEGGFIEVGVDAGVGTDNFNNNQSQSGGEGHQSPFQGGIAL